MVHKTEIREREERAARLVRARKAAGFKGPKAVHDRFGFNINNYKAHEQGRNGFGLSDAKAYAKAFNVSVAWLNNNVGEPETFASNARETLNPALPTKLLTVKGTVEAGAFRDISLLQEGNSDDLPTINVLQDPRFNDMKQYALKVAGDSMDLKYPNGSFVTCVAWGDAGRKLKPGMCLHVEKYEGHLVENTLKCYAERNGKRFLDPLSRNPAHKPIEMNGNDATEITVKGLVTGSWIPEDY